MEKIKNFPNLSGYDDAFVVDIETNGLIGWNKPNPLTEYDQFPRIVQICYAHIKNGDFANIEYNTYTIKPDNWTIPQATSVIHGITDEIAMNEGVDIKIPLMDLYEKINASKKSILIAHNLNFDWSIIQSECMRNSIKVPEPSLTYCTMLHSQNAMIESYGKPKWPKLKELYKVILKEELNQTHKADGDVIALVDILKEVQNAKYPVEV